MLDFGTSYILFMFISVFNIVYILLNMIKI